MKIGILFLACCLTLLASSQEDARVKRKDRKKDIEMVTTEGTIILRLSDATPVHRDDFLRLVKAHHFDSMLFHRVIKNFMIQSGDPASKPAKTGQPAGDEGLGYTLPAEFRDSLFHKKGALAAARMGDSLNPEKRSDGGQFYLVQGRTFTDHELDSIEVKRLFGRKLLPQRREYYKTIGGTPQLDSNYTVFGEVVSGQEVVDKIAAAPGDKADRPLVDRRIVSVRLIRRNKKLTGTF